MKPYSPSGDVQKDTFSSSRRDREIRLNWSTKPSEAIKDIEDPERHARHRRVGIRLATCALAAIIIPSYLDISHNQEIAAEAHPTISIIADAKQNKNNDTALIFIDGFGSYNADTLTKSIGPASQQITDGQLWSVDFGDAPLDTNTIAEKIIKMTAERNVNKVVIEGYSAGGIIGLAVGAAIKQTSDLITIERIDLYSSPDSLRNLRPERQTEAASYADLVGSFPWMAYYDPARFVGEMIARNPEYTNQGLDTLPNFINTITNIRNDLASKHLPGTWLLTDQYLAIKNADVQHSIEKLAKDDGSILPVISYFGTGKPGYDYMVDDDASSKKYQEYTEKAGLVFESFDVPDAIHTRPDLTVKQYMTTLALATTSIHRAMIAAQAKYDETYPVLITEEGYSYSVLSASIGSSLAARRAGK